MNFWCFLDENTDEKDKIVKTLMMEAAAWICALFNCFNTISILRFFGGPGEDAPEGNQN